MKCAETNPACSWEMWPRYLCAALTVAACLYLAGCTVGPNYKRPDAPVPPAYKENGGTTATVPPPNPPGGTWKPAQPADDVLRGKWWELYGDPQLNALEDKVAVSNQTLKAATEQYFSAREQVQVSRAAYYPTLSLDPSISRNRSSLKWIRLSWRSISDFNCNPRC